MPLPPEFGRPDLPIIGQPKVGNWFFTVLIVCPCGTSLLLIGQLGSQSVCTNRECGKVYQLNGMPTINEAGNVSVPLSMSVPVKTGPAQ